MKVPLQKTVEKFDFFKPKTMGGKILLVILKSSLTVAVILWLILINTFGNFNMAERFLMIIIPIIAFIIFVNNKTIRWYLFACILFGVLFFGFRLAIPEVELPLEPIDPFDTYMVEESEFTEVALKFMPTVTTLKKSNVVHYEYSKNYMYRLSAVYVEEDFISEKARLEEHYNEHIKPIGSPGEYSFYLDGALYNCFCFMEKSSYYAFAYHVCEDTKTISYFFVEDDASLSSMTVGDLVECHYGVDRVFLP